MTMTIDDPRYAEFLDRLAAALELTSRADGSTNCRHDHRKHRVIAVLREMGLGFDAIRSTIAYHEARGGFCDCEVLMHVGVTAGDEEALRAVESVHSPYVDVVNPIEEQQRAQSDW